MHTLAQLCSGTLAGSKRLDLSCDLEDVPSEVFALADTLEVLNLSGNRLKTLPPQLSQLRNLKVLFCSHNEFQTLPEVVGACPELRMVGFKANKLRHLPACALPSKLRWLTLSDNQLTQLPESLGQRPALEKVLLAGNALAALPESLQQCHNLALLRLSANQFTHLPSWLLRLPSLAWLAFGGNPWGASREEAVLSQSDIPNIAWSALRLGPMLGQGASGVIHAAQWFSETAPVENIAIKLFKGEVTSDGWPHSEWAACLATGVHAHLIGARGRLVGHPTGAEGLVMPRIPDRFHNLAAPPSLDSCTRDVYADGVALTLPVLRRMACAVADAGQHLHARGIAHGDLYGHNLMCSPEGELWLGDFGAATLLPADASLEQRQLVERLDVRAFGLLLEEWLQRCAEPDSEAEALKAGCLQPDVSVRPSFAELKASWWSKACWR